MKNFFRLFCLALLPAALYAENSADAVACIGKIVPGARISKLAAPSLGGSQAIVETLNIRKGMVVEKGRGRRGSARRGSRKGGVADKLVHGVA